MSTKRDTRCELLKTAKDLIWSHAYEGLSVDEICKAAKIQKGSFYHFFSSKAELAREALEFLWKELQPDLDHVFSPQKPGLQRLKDCAAGTLKEQEVEAKKRGYIVGCPFCTVGSEQCSSDEGLTELSWEIILRLRKYIVIALRDAIAEGAIKKIDPEKVADEINAHILGALVSARLSRSFEPVKDLYSVWRRIIKGYEEMSDS